MITATRYIGKTIKIKIDRPQGSKHPKHGFLYEVNYGFVPNTLSGDGEELDAYVLGIDVPAREFEGVCIAVIHRLDDNDDKLVIVPKGASFTDEEIERQTKFQEKWFKSLIIRNPNITKAHFGIYGIARKEDKILGIKKARGPYTGLYDLPGGRQEKGESYEETLIREVKEETGCKVLSSSNMRDKQIVFSSFTEASKEIGILEHSAVLFDIEIDGNLLEKGDGLDSNGSVWVKVSELNLENATPLLLITADKELVAIADKNDNVVGVHQRGVPLPEDRYGMIACLLVFNSLGDIILHKIAPHKTWAGLWTYSAAGHVDAGETYEQAAIREAKEELGIDVKTVQEIAVIPFYRNEKHTGFHHVYKTVYDGEFNPDKDEIAEIKKFSPEALKKEISQNPENFFPELLIAINKTIYINNED